MQDQGEKGGEGGGYIYIGMVSQASSASEG